MRQYPGPARSDEPDATGARSGRSAAGRIAVHFIPQYADISLYPL